MTGPAGRGGPAGVPRARVVLVRHGETVWHADNRFAGSSDVVLTPRGHRQAELLAAWAAGAGLSALWCSPLARARDTAAAVARATGLELHVDPRLRELDFGRAEGHTPAEMERLWPDRVAAWRADPVAGHLPGGEDPRAAADRGVACLHDLAVAQPGGRVLAVAHNTLLRLVLCRLLGLPLRDYRRRFPSMRNCALTELRLDGEVVSLLQFNVPVDGPG
jgi:broad specificity phosphatase PhoE